MAQVLKKIENKSINVGFDDFITINYSNIEITESVRMYLEEVYNELRNYKYDLKLYPEHQYHIIDTSNMHGWPSMPIPRPYNLIINIPNKDNDGNIIGSYDIIYLGEKYNRTTGVHDTHIIAIYLDNEQEYSDMYTFEVIDNNTMIFILDNIKYDIYFKSDDYNPVKYWEDIIQQ